MKLEELIKFLHKNPNPKNNLVQHDLKIKTTNSKSCYKDKKKSKKNFSVACSNFLLARTVDSPMFCLDLSRINYERC